jgi:transcriptional regulator with XRE-family HTH domain
MNTISENIKNKLREEGFKLEFVANELGITQGTLSQKLGNADGLKYKTILEISKVTGIPMVDFVTYPEKYELVTKDCAECKKKDLIIENLNDYINLLKNKKA